MRRTLCRHRRTHPLPHDGVIVDDHRLDGRFRVSEGIVGHDPATGSCTVTRVPPLSPVVNETRPPGSSARSRIDGRPRPAEDGRSKAQEVSPCKPMPSSSTVNTTAALARPRVSRDCPDSNLTVAPTLVIFTSGEPQDDRARSVPPMWLRPGSVGTLQVVVIRRDRSDRRPSPWRMRRRSPWRTWRRRHRLHRRRRWPAGPSSNRTRDRCDYRST